mmetsp:Transcript_38374/g.90220  ORF Transcript_38374/g.90220 Transcript_38374/m.90220 type:complete len:239 (+) Transcript_38374:1270-1986(+)
MKHRLVLRVCNLFRPSTQCTQKEKLRARLHLHLQRLQLRLANTCASVDILRSCIRAPAPCSVAEAHRCLLSLSCALRLQLLQLPLALQRLRLGGGQGLLGLLPRFLRLLVASPLLLQCCRQSSLHGPTAVGLGSEAKFAFILCDDPLQLLLMLKHTRRSISSMLSNSKASILLALVQEIGAAFLKHPRTGTSLRYEAATFSFRHQVSNEIWRRSSKKQPGRVGINIRCLHGSHHYFQQ